MGINDTITAFYNMVLPAVTTIEGKSDIKIVGSARRRMSAKEAIPENIHDIEFVMAHHPSTLMHFDLLLKQGKIKKGHAWGEKYKALIFQQIKFDVFFHVPENRGFQTWLRTGPSDANEWFVAHIKNNAPYVVKEGFIWTLESCVWKADIDETGKDRGTWMPNAQSVKIDCPDEWAWFELWGMPYIEPHIRSEFIYKTYMTIGHQFGVPRKLIQPPPPPPEQTGLF
ncbi:MAG: hypothetical protein SFZ02_12315 [bacterium]|nr:hypothetical protein [bacterium]